MTPRLQHARLPCQGACSNSCPFPSCQWCHETILSSIFPFSSCLQSLPASGYFPTSQFFASEGQKYWSFSFSINPYNEYSGFISFRIDLFDLLAVQGTLKSVFQHHSSKISILRHSAFFMVQLSHPYMTTGRTIILTIQTFVGKVMSLLFNILSRFVMAFLPRSKLLLISWLQSPFTVILEPKKIKSVTVSIVSPSKGQTKIKPQCHMWSLIAYGTGIAKFVKCYRLWKPSFWISINHETYLWSTSLPVIVPDVQIKQHSRWQTYLLIQRVLTTPSRLHHPLPIHSPFASALSVILQLLFLIACNTNTDATQTLSHTFRDYESLIR